MSVQGGPGGASASRRAIVSIPAPISSNRYQRLLYEQLNRHGIQLAPTPGSLTLGWLWRARRGPPILHFHWPEYAYRDGWPLRTRRGTFDDWRAVVRFGLHLAVGRGLGYRIVWTVHEVIPHDRRGACDWVASALLAALSRTLIVHDESTGRRSRRLPGAGRKIVQIPHASYAGAYPRSRSTDEVRDALGLDWARFVFLSFGRVRRYKGLPLLLEAFTGTSRELPDVALVVAGAPQDAEDAGLVRAAEESDPRVRTVFYEISDYAVADLFAACDACVYARGDGGTSGSVLLALSLGTPAVLARCEAYVELVGEEVAGWLYEPGDAASLRAALLRAADPAAAAVRGLRASERVAGRSWDAIGERTAEILLRS